MKPGSSEAPKKPYQTPKLLAYGDLTEMTLAMGNMGKLDGGAIKGMRRTGG